MLRQNIKMRIQWNLTECYCLIVINFHHLQQIIVENIYIGRFLILSCDNVIPIQNRDSQLLEKLLAEREVITSLAVKSLQETISRGYKFTESERTKKNREEYAIKNNSLKLFLQEYCVIGEGRTVTSVFKEKYKKWCKENNLEPEPANNINSILIQEYGVVKGKSYHEYYELSIKE